MPTIKHRRGSAAQWAAVDPVLHEGEFGLATDLRQLKIGNGTTPWSGLSALFDGAAQEQSESIVMGVSPEQFGAVGGGAVDDTAAVIQAVNTLHAQGGGSLLLEKFYGISDEIQCLGFGTAVTVIGSGRESSGFKALGPDAALTWGDGPTSLTSGVTRWGRSGTNRDFYFLGQTVAKQGIHIGSANAHCTWANISVYGVDGEGWLVYPQNCTFINCVSQGCSGNGWGLTYGIQTCEFINCHGIANDGWQFQIRQDGGYGWGASAQPQDLAFRNGIVEQGGTSIHGGVWHGGGLGGFHIREGLDITFDRFELVENGPTNEGALVLTPSTANGYVGRITLRDCRVNGVHIKANNGSGVAQSMGGTNEPLMLVGWNQLVYGGVVTNGSTARIKHDGLINVPYVAEGVGAPATLQTPSPHLTGCRLTIASNQTLVSGNAQTAISFDAEDYDTHGFHNDGANFITIPGDQSGYYNIIATLLHTQAGVSGEHYHTYLVVNGVTKVYASEVGNGLGAISKTMTTELYLTAGQTVQLKYAVPKTGRTADASSTSLTLRKIGVQ